ncbi:MAG: two-component system response regulator [Geobacter sp.]|nr:MAG: two-component system response regulator [Geobacter sp.]
MAEKKQLGDLLVEAGIITVKTLERALERQKGSGKRLGLVLEEMGVITDEELVDALAKQFGFKTVKGFSTASFPRELLDMVPEDLAVQKQLFPIKEKDGMLAIAVTDPFDNDTFDFIAKKSGKKVFPVLATRKEVGEALKKSYLLGQVASNDKIRILVVDDSQPIATIIQVALQKEGFDVDVAHDGLEGLKLAMTTKPDLIICDSVMPRMDGYGLMRAIKGNPAIEDVPMILLTSKASGEDEQKALEIGFIDFIPKPVQPIRVVSRVKRALELLKKYK